MYKFQTRTFGQVAVATLLSLGLTAGVVSAASATTHLSKPLSHMSVYANVSFQGVVTALPTGGVTVKNAKGTSDTFTIASTTTMLRATNVKHTVTLAIGDRVEVRALASAPTVATSINILAVRAQKSLGFRGVVTVLPAGLVTVVNAKGTSETFTIATTTKWLGSKHTLVVNDRVEVRALASAPTVATSINNLGK